MEETRHAATATGAMHQHEAGHRPRGRCRTVTVMLSPSDLRLGDIVELSEQGVHELTFLGSGFETSRFSVRAMDLTRGTITLIPVGLRRSADLTLPIWILEDARKVPIASALN